ncbi:alpha/beta-hydrolase [Mycena sp. CBHHK59/15]|nr:alpha/beta-hydrolase [Mycena sp. CBHHK59/15]
MIKKAPYGTWSSPTTVDTISNTNNLAGRVDILVATITTEVYHIEKRPSEGGRDAIVHTETGRDLTGVEWDVRTKVNGHGGAPAIVHNGVAYFSHVRDGRVYKVNVDGSDDGSDGPEAITPENTAHKFANFDVYPADPITTFLVSVMEDHTGCTSPSEVANSLCILNVSTKTVSPLMAGASFYASPKFSPDGRHLAWMQWNLPDMPWVGSEIWVVDFLVESHGLVLQHPRRVAGEHGKISVAYPSWVSDNVLLFTSDVSGFQNPWKYECAAGAAQPVLAAPIAESFGYGSPQKRLGWSPYAIADSRGISEIFTAIKDGRSVLYLVDLASGTAQALFSPYVEIEHIRGTKVDTAPALIECTLLGTADAIFIDLQCDSHGALPPEYLSHPEPITLMVPSEMGIQPVHVIYYPRIAQNTQVSIGPVGFSGQGLIATKQFFTRGWAWLDVNYGGSSGYGRAYMERLRGKWGIVDVDDCIAAARALSSAPYNLIDPRRIMIRGASAGGFTVLSALSRPGNVGIFAAGTSLYGILDLRRLEMETHKFESGYLEMLVGEDRQVLTDRSPVFNADKIVAPLLILQGDADQAVPKSQAEGMVESIRQRGGMVEYKLYSGEGHGWARNDTMEDALRSEIQFYNSVLGLT